MKPRVVFFMLFAGVLSVSISGILIRYASPYIDSVALAFWRSFISIGLLAPFAIKQRVPQELAKLPKKDKFLILLSGILLGLHFMAWIAALSYTSIASSTVLVHLTPIFSAIFGLLLLRERLSRGVIFGIGLSFIGSLLLGTGDQQGGTFPNAMWGNVLALLGAVAATGYLLAGRSVRQKGLSWLGYVFPVYAVAALIVGILALLNGISLALPQEVFFIVLLIAIFPQIIGHGSFNYALKYYNAAFLGVIGLIEPIFAALMAFFLFGELPTQLSMMGMSIILGAVALAMFSESQEKEKISPSQTD